MTTARDVLAGLTVEQRIGQLFATSVGHHSSAEVNPSGRPPGDSEQRSESDHRRGLAADRDRVAEEISRYGLGGVCYFPGRPAGNLPEDVAELTEVLAGAAPLGLLVSTDQEGGRVARLRQGFTHFGSAMSMAALDDPTAIREAAAVTGRELRAVGINHVFAPVADVNSNPDNPVIGTRSFGSDPVRVAACVVAAIVGYRDAAVASTAKHFPGHGDTALDSHLGLPVIGRTESDWRRVDQPTFAAAITAGVDTVMSGHLVLGWAQPATGAGIPATYSPVVLTELLRTEMGFSGLVVSDALGMAAAVQGRDPAIDALLAGVDQLLMPVDVGASVAALCEAVDRGRVPLERLDQACLRVLELKERLGLLGPSVASDRTAVGTSTGLAVELAARAVTVLGPPFLAFAPSRAVAVLGPGPAAGDLRSALRARGRTVLLDEDSGRADAAVVVVSTDLRQPGELDEVRRLLSAYPAAVLVVAGSPYGADLVDSHPVLLGYGATPTHLDGLAVALTDPARPPSGRLPVARGKR